MPSPDTPPFGSGQAPPAGWLGRTRNSAYNRIGGMFLKGLRTAYAQQRAALGLSTLRRGEGVFDHMVSPMLHLQASTPMIEYPRGHPPSTVHFVEPLLSGPPMSGELPDWWDELDGTRPVVHVTQGTVATDPATLCRPAMDGLAGFDGLVVVTTLDPRRLGPVPANVRVSSFIPHALLLPRVRAVVTNAGFNGAKMALAHGLPQVFAPWGNDQPDVAARIAWAGAGINLRARAPTPDAIRTAVTEVLTNDAYRQAALVIQREFGTYPGGEPAATLLEQLVRHAAGRPGPRHP